MGLFGGKKDKKDPQDASAQSPGDAGASQGGEAAPDQGKPGKGAKPGVSFSPEKAEPFFERARHMHETASYEYAMTLWLNGLRFDPSNIGAMEGFFRSASAFAADKPKKKPKVELASKSEVDKFLNALLQWAARLEDGDAAARAGEAAIALSLEEQAYWCLERAMALSQRAKRPSPSAFKKLMQLFAKIGAFEQAVQAGQIAVQLAPADNDLANMVKNFSAQATMSQGGYDDTGKEGGFRKNIRDAKKQQQLQDEEAISKDSATIERLVQRARDDYEERPEDPAAINILAKRLTERGTPDDEKQAYELFKKAYQITREFRFRQAADDIKLRAWRRKLAALEKKANDNPDDPAAADAYQSARKDVLEAETKVYAARVEAYPTDLGLKFELGRRYFELEQYEDAVGMLQAAQSDPKLRVRALHMLARGFLAMGWGDEAVTTFRQALEAHGRDSDDAGMEISYGLMEALLERAKQSGDPEAAAEADRIASSIAIRNIRFREIRDRRDEIKALLADMRKV